MRNPAAPSNLVVGGLERSSSKLLISKPYISEKNKIRAYATIEH